MWCVSVNGCPPSQMWLDCSGAVLHIGCEVFGDHSEWKVLHNVKTNLYGSIWTTTCIQGWGEWREQIRIPSASLGRWPVEWELCQAVSLKRSTLCNVSTLMALSSFLPTMPILTPFDELGTNNDTRSSFPLYLGRQRTGPSYSLWGTGLGQPLLHYHCFPFLNVKEH